MKDLSTHSELYLNNVLSKAAADIAQEAFVSAMDGLRLAANIAPDSPEVAHLLGLLALREGRVDLSIPLLEKALRAGYSQVMLHHAAEAYLFAGDLMRASELLNVCIEQFGEDVSTLGLQSAIAIAAEDYSMAAAAAKKTMDIAPSFIGWWGNYAFAQLAQQQYLSGFQLHTGRAENLVTGSRCPTLQFCKGFKLSIKKEQGLGDMLFFLRYVPVLYDLGFELYLEADSKIGRLLYNTGFFKNVLPSIRMQEDDYWLNAGDLPLAAIQLGGRHIMPALKMQPDPAYIKIIQKKLSSFGPPPYVAVTWRAGPGGRKQRAGLCMYDKYVSAFKLGEAIKSTNVTVISIQRHPDLEEMQAFEQGLERECFHMSSLNDKLEYMLALLSLVDDYIAVPNTNVHLMAALAKHAYVLVNAPLQDWRWLPKGSTSPFYEGMEIFRQEKSGSWDAALQLMSIQFMKKYGTH